MSILNRINAGKVSVAVVGMGYVGLPLMVRMGEVGLKVKGIDLDINKVDCINSGQSYIHEVDDQTMKSLVERGRLSAQNHYDNLEEFDVIIVCVPTPITTHKEPDLTCIDAAVEKIALHLRKDHVVILESTTFPGTTEERVLPVLARTGMKVGEDFYLGFSPERVDPANKEYGIQNTPKVVSGVTAKCTEVMEAFYRLFVDHVHKVSTPKTAEMAKLLENTFRNINIALVNQLAVLCHYMGINVWEVVEAAATKPFGFMPFFPGPGLGGHCIPVDPLYLSWKAKEYDFFFLLIEAANDINRAMPSIVVHRITELLNAFAKPLVHSTILLLGVSYKQNVGDIRESPALRIIKSLQEKGCHVCYNDEYVKELTIDGCRYQSQPLKEELLSSCDCTVILTSHDYYDFHWIVKHCRVVFDTRNATRHVAHQRHKIVTL